MPLAEVLSALAYGQMNTLDQPEEQNHHDHGREQKSHQIFPSLRNHGTRDQVPLAEESAGGRKADDRKTAHEEAGHGEGIFEKRPRKPSK